MRIWNLELTLTSSQSQWNWPDVLSSGRLAVILIRLPSIIQSNTDCLDIRISFINWDRSSMGLWNNFTIIICNISLWFLMCLYFEIGLESYLAYSEIYRELNVQKVLWVIAFTVRFQYRVRCAHRITFP